MHEWRNMGIALSLLCSTVSEDESWGRARKQEGEIRRY